MSSEIRRDPDSWGKTVFESILSWISEGILAENWQIFTSKWEENRGVIEADAPGIPGKLHVEIVEEAVRMAVELDMETVDMLPHKKAALYRKFLKISRFPLVKVYLIGEEHEPVVAVDLPTRGLTRELFELSLKALLASLIQLAAEGLGEKLAELELKTLRELVEHMRQNGVSKKEAYKRLVSSGLDKKIAKAIVEEVFGSDVGGLLIH